MLKRTNIHLDTEQRDWLREEFFRTGEKPAELARTFIQEGIDRRNSKRRKDRRGPRPLTRERRKAAKATDR